MSSTDHQPWFETPDYQAFVSASIVGDHVVNQQWRSNSLDVSPPRSTAAWPRNTVRLLPGMNPPSIQDVFISGADIVQYQSPTSNSMDSYATSDDSRSPLDSYGSQHK